MSDDYEEAWRQARAGTIILAEQNAALHRERDEACAEVAQVRGWLDTVTKSRDIAERAVIDWQERARASGDASAEANRLTDKLIAERDAAITKCNEAKERCKDAEKRNREGSERLAEVENELRKVIAERDVANDPWVKLCFALDDHKILPPGPKTPTEIIRQLTLIARERDAALERVNEFEAGTRSSNVLVSRHESYAMQARQDLWAEQSRRRNFTERMAKVLENVTSESTLDIVDFEVRAVVTELQKTREKLTETLVDNAQLINDRLELRQKLAGAETARDSAEAIAVVERRRNENGIKYLREVETLHASTCDKYNELCTVLDAWWRDTYQNAVTLPGMTTVPVERLQKLIASHDHYYEDRQRLKKKLGGEDDVSIQLIRELREAKKERDEARALLLNVYGNYERVLGERDERRIERDEARAIARQIVAEGKVGFGARDLILSWPTL